MRVYYTCPVYKILNGYLEIPDEMIKDKNEEERTNLYKAAIARQFSSLKTNGHYILEDEITFEDTEII